jgi:asparagine N-glycosylation enzyme membrane subunit Stt3
MNINKNLFKSLIWIIPAIIVFFLALIPTLKYQWPLSWDIIYHIQYAQVYAKYGFVLKDPLLNAPFGQEIGYPPLFHFIIVALSNIIHVNYFQIARYLQPFIVMFIVLSVSFVSRKFYGTIAGVSAGFLMISSLLIGNRIIYPLPENLALIFLPLSVYFYYYSIKVKSFKYAILAGSLLMIVALIHQAATLILFLIITVFTLIELIFYRNIRVLKNYGAFFFLPIIILIIGVLTLLLISPNFIHNIINEGIKAATGYATSLPNSQPLGILSYLWNLSYLILIFALVGTIVAIKRRRKKDVFILTWTILMILVSNAYVFGVNVISYRLLVYILIPLSILGGFGVSWVYKKFKDNKKFSSQKFRTGFLILTFTLATISGIIIMNNPNNFSFDISNQYGTFQIAPPSSSEVDLSRWFNEYGDKSKSIMSNDLFPMTFVTTQTGMPLTSDVSFDNFNNTTSESTLKQNKIGYIVLDKRLSFNSTNGTLYKVRYDAEFYEIYYYSEDIHSNINEILPSYIKVVYENKDFIVCQVQ